MDERSYGIIPIAREPNGTILFLIVQHTEGHFAFPKGRAVGDETYEQTALRELCEETGIRECQLLPAVSFNDHYSFERNGHLISKDVKYFVGKVRKQQITLSTDELKDYRWAPFSEAIRLITHPSTKKILEECIRRF